MTTDNNIKVDSIAAQIANAEIESGRIQGMFDVSGVTTAKSFAQLFGCGTWSEAWRDKAREFIDENEFVEVSVGGYKEYVPLLTKSENNAKPGYVYLITDGFAVKIGKSEKPTSRFDKIQNGNPRKIVLLQLIETDDMDRVEQSLHIWYRGFRTNGEWFFLLPLFGLDPSDCIERALGAQAVRYDHSYSVNFSTNIRKTDVTKIWIRNPDEDEKTVSKNYVKNSF